MFPPPPLHLSDDDTHGFSRYIKRRDWLMARCDGPIVLMAPKLGPNNPMPGPIATSRCIKTAIFYIYQALIKPALPWY